jgi:hypothetical protein
VLYWVAQRVEWQLLWGAAATLLLTVALFALARWAFGLIRQKRQQIAFCIATPILLFVAFASAVFAIAYFQPRPDFKAYVRMASTANTTDVAVKTPLVLVISIANVGTMQSTVDDWQLTVDLNNGRYFGTLAAVTPESRMRFRSGSGGGYYLFPEGWLYTKGLESIAPGEMATGFLIFQFPELSSGELSRPAARFSLTFHDILQRPYDLRIGSDRLNSHTPFFPGVIEPAH